MEYTYNFLMSFFLILLICIIPGSVSTDFPSQYELYFPAYLVIFYRMPDIVNFTLVGIIFY